MRADRIDFWKRLGVRFLLAVPFFGVAFVLMAAAMTAGDRLAVYTTFCFGAFFLVIGASFIAPVVAGEFGIRLSMSLLLPERELTPAPRYSIAESLVKKGRYEDAVAAYDAISAEFPQVVKPYADKIDVVLLRLGDALRAEHAFRDAMATLESPEDRDELRNWYRALQSQAAPKPEWLQRTHIALPDDAAARRRPRR
jgi:hypothetical protein